MPRALLGLLVIAEAFGLLVLSPWFCTAAEGQAVLSPPSRPGAPIAAPLRVHPINPRYFSDGTGRAILLTGSHTWNNLVDMGPDDPPRPFDYEAYLAWLGTYPHNFIRLWTWELTAWDTRGNREKKPRVHHVQPLPWKRTGPGKALDGKPKFDLAAFDDEYFHRLRQRVGAAEQRGIYVSVMLFEGWGLQFSPEAWKHHPFHPANNVQAIDGDLNGDGRGLEIHTGRSLEITELQRAYVRKVIDTVNEFNNVLYEISNENHPPSTAWQYEMIRFIKRYEKTLPKQHPVGMTFQYRGGSNKTLFDSPADWISPNPEGGYRTDPPPANGTKVLISDTDHLWGIGGNPAWVWKSFLRGCHPIFMDPYRGAVLDKRMDDATLEAVRKAMGRVLQWSRRIDLASMIPRTDLASSRYCLANPGVEYLVYVPRATKAVMVKLRAGRYARQWYDPATGSETREERFQHAHGERAFESPVAGAAILYIRRAQ